MAHNLDAGFRPCFIRASLARASDAQRWATSTRMRKIRQLFLISLAVCVLPVAAHAQWASSKTEHDWRLSIGGHSFGLVQQAVYTVSLGSPSYRRTTIYLGPFYTTTTRFRAPWLAVVLLLPVGAAGVFVLARLLPGKRES